jgi:hypothetical protein
MIDSPPSLSSPVNSSSRYVEVCCAYPCGDPCPTTPYQTDGPNTRAHPFLKCRSILRPQVPHYRSQTQSRHRERLASAPIGMTVSLAIACRWGASDRQHASVSASADEYLYCLLYLRTTWYRGRERRACWTPVLGVPRPRARPHSSLAFPETPLLGHPTYAGTLQALRWWHCIASSLRMRAICLH